MAFNDYTRVDAVVKKHKVKFDQGSLLPPDPSAPLFSDYFREELASKLRMLP